MQTIQRPDGSYADVKSEPRINAERITERFEGAGVALTHSGRYVDMTDIRPSPAPAPAR